MSPLDRNTPGARPEPATAPAAGGWEAPPRTAEEIEDWLVSRLAGLLEVESAAILVHQPFSQYGLDSAGAVRLAGEMEQWLGRRLSQVLVWDYPTIEALARHLASEREPAPAGATGDTDRAEPLAIIGMGLRSPGAETPAAFWRLLRAGVNAVSEIPPGRWDVAAYYDPDPATPAKMCSRWGGFLKQVDEFDPLFFGISPREALVMDPQQRLLLEVTWEALEDAGLAPEPLAGSATGVFVGICGTDYSHIAAGLPDALTAHAGTGNALSIAANRLSYVLDLQGPSLAVDTACSSSLVAAHLAVRSLRSRECDLALVGGVNLVLYPDVSVTFSQARMMAPDGRCKTFDAAANGYVRAEGCGVVVLKRLSDAVRDGDRLLALVRGSAVNQDGRSNGLTAPNGPAQQAVIRAALADGGVPPGEVSYVEAHGTGTPLGDPIEVEALAQVLGAGRPPDQPLAIGSVKTNVGHAEGAAGIISLIKVVLALQHGEIPPHLHLRDPNPHIPWAELPVVVPTQLTTWQPASGRRLAGVSSFGFGGTNAHVVLEAAPRLERPPAAVERPLQLLTLSARSESALRTLAGRFADHLASDPELSLTDVGFTANTGRSHFDHRLALVGATREGAREQLAEVHAGQEPAGVRQGRVPTSGKPRVAFLFTGQGAQYIGMGRTLFETQPTFRQALQRCNDVLHSFLPRPLLEVLYPAAGADSPLDETAYAQPALFAVEYALAELWRSWGVEPSRVVGHSVGEYVAACVAGVFSLEDGLRLVAERGRLMQAQPGGGAMAAVFADEARVAAALAPYRGEASIAAVNGSEQVVISGAAAAVKGVLAALAADGVRAQRLTVSHAFHSPLMEPVLEPFRRVAQAVPCAAARVPLVSNLDGRLLADGQVLDAAYWVRHVREPVAFAAGVRTLADQGCRLWLEIGPGPVLLGLARRCLDPDVDAVWLPSLRPGQDDWRPLLDSLSALYVEGVAVDWAGFDRDYPRRRLALPTYPFERQRYWLPPVANGRPAARGAGPTQPGSPHELLGRRLASPLKETLFEARLGPRTPPYLGDHRILGTAVLPLAGFLEMALAAARHVFGEGPCRVEDVVAEEWLLLPEEQEQTVQMIVSPQGPGQASFQVFRQAAEDGGKEAWRVHARGTIRTGAEAVEPEDLDAVRTRCPEELEIGQCYQEMRDRGLEYGPGFQGLVRIRRGAGEAIGQIQLPEPLVAGADACRFHPALLDACIHPIGKALPDLSTSAAWIPVGLERLTIFGRPGTRVWCHARVRPEDPAHRNRRVGDLMIVDDAGQLVAHLAGLQVQQVGRDVLQRSTQLRRGDWLYHLEWQPRALTGPEWTLGDGPGRWLIFADRDGTGVELAELLEARGESCHVVFAGDPGLAPAARHGCIDPADRAAYARLLREGRREGGPPWRGVVHLWGLEDTPDEEDTAEALQAALPLKVGSALYLAQALAAAGSSRPPRLWLVTRGTQRAEAGSDAGTLQGAPLWGLARVIALEQPELRCTCLDLDPAASRDEARTVYREVRAGDGEDQIAFRGGDRLVARLMRGLGGGDGGLQIPEGEAFQLETSQAGVLENLVLRPMSRRAPGPGEVEIRVRATGQNFRDVLCALGMYPGEMPPLGGECAGQVVRAGEGVRAFRPGDEVVAIAPGSFASHVTVDTRLVVARPPRLTPEEAATVPIAFLTAWYGLHTLARLGPGERVLIHAAAGGVGMAAVQLARRAGAEVFATASPSKWDAVKALGVEHVMNSRSLDFASEVMERTGGRGVDVVLNSLVGDYIPKSLGVLAPGGRFLEIGKREIWDRERVEHVKPGVAYIAYDLAELAGREPDRLQDLFRTLMEALQAGDLQPLPRRDYPIQDVGDAFRHMAQAKHVGKIVIVPPRDGTGLLEGAASVVRPDRTYLITGGVGALGLQVASWMVGQGARSLVLVGRRGSSPESAAALAQLREQGAQVVTAAADVARTEQVAGVLADAARSLPPLAGVVHAAGVLEDALLAQQDWERFARVLAPKVAGAWNLHCLTKDLPLDFFVLFSSAASLLGSPGQANYAAANAFLDALARHRRALHLPALSINWGPWAGAGMAAGRDGRDQGRRAAQGVGVIAPEQGLATLARLLGQPSPAQVAVLPIDWGTFLGQFPAGGLPPLLAELARTEQAGGQPAPPTAEQLRFLKDLAEAAPAQRRGLLLAHVREQVCKVLGLPPGQALDVHRGLMDLGMDSLMAVELRNRLQASLGQPLPATLMFENPTVAVLAESLLTEVLYPEAAPPPPVSSPPAKEAELDGLAEAEMAALLAEKLTALERDRT